MSSNDERQNIILIADYNPVFRLGLRSLLDSANMFPKILEVGSKAELFITLGKQKVDVVLLGIGSANESNDLGWSATSKEIKARFQSARVLLIPRSHEIYSLEEVMETGASGYLPMVQVKGNLIAAIQKVAEGSIFVEGPFGGKELISNRTGRSREGKGKVKITKREQEILALIFEEYTNPEIANLLGISRRTVDTHRKNLLRKLNVRNTAGLIRYALKSGFVEI